MAELDLSQLEAVREAVAGVLNAVEIKAVDYTSEVITPPGAAVVPGQPYLTWGDDRVAFAAPVTLHLDVLLIVARDVGKRQATQADQLIGKAVQALLDAEYDVTAVSQPDVVTLSGAKFMGSVITVEQPLAEKND